ncbi:MAG: hypothetical protein JWM27_2269 [Gemmatimonadetes bacterium]|nr:hypothetical protein [Gemmatimonadota bacterium]
MTSECHVSGTWQVEQSNGYRPVFALEEHGGTVRGAGTLSSADQARGNYSGPTGPIEGRLHGNRLEIRVNWPPKNDGTRAIGHYAGVVVEHQIVDGFAHDDLNPEYKGSWRAVRV